MFRLFGLLLVGLVLAGCQTLPSCPPNTNTSDGCAATLQGPIDNSKYVGEVKDGQPHGSGKFSLEHCYLATGEWKNGTLFEGTITFSYPGEGDNPLDEDFFTEKTIKVKNGEPRAASLKEIHDSWVELASKSLILKYQK